MKNLSAIVNNKDIATKEYTDKQIIISDVEPNENYKIWIDTSTHSLDFVTHAELNQAIGNIETLLSEV